MSAASHETGYIPEREIAGKDRPEHVDARSYVKTPENNEKPVGGQTVEEVESLMHDNQMGDSDDPTPATAIGGGSLFIHTAEQGMIQDHTHALRQVARPQSNDSVQHQSLDLRKLLQVMLVSREGDRREYSLIRQGKGWMHIAGMGHEPMAVLNDHLTSEDYLFLCYRDRGR